MMNASMKLICSSETLVQTHTHTHYITIIILTKITHFIKKIIFYVLIKNKTLVISFMYFSLKKKFNRGIITCFKNLFIILKKKKQQPQLNFYYKLRFRGVYNNKKENIFNFLFFLFFFFLSIK
jgi:hypothetical protein